MAARHLRNIVTAGCACLALAACSQQQDGSAKAVIAPPVPARAHDGSQDLLDAINRLRKERRRGTLAVDHRLVMAARDHSRSMAQHGFFAHRGRDGGLFSKRMARHGYPRSHSAENIAMAPDAATVFRLWHGSRGHRESMVNRKYTRVGIAREGDYWTAVFAAPDGT